MLTIKSETWNLRATQPCQNLCTKERKSKRPMRIRSDSCRATPKGTRATLSFSVIRQNISRVHLRRTNGIPTLLRAYLCEIYSVAFASVSETCVWQTQPFCGELSADVAVFDILRFHVHLFEATCRGLFRKIPKLARSPKVSRALFLRKR